MIKPEDYPIIERIKALRESSGLSQAKFASLIGVSSGNVGQWERYSTLPGAIALRSIAQKLGCSVDWILTGDELKPRIKKIEIIPDPDLNDMIEILTVLMESGDADLRGWTKVQFQKAFREHWEIHLEKKLQA